MMLRSSSMIRSEKLQRRNCPTSMRMVSPSCERRGRAHRRFPDHDRPVGLEHFQSADPLVVIAQNLQQDIAAGSRRKQDVVFLEQARVIRDEILGFRCLELEPAAHRARAPAQVDQIHLAVVMENDPVFQRSFDLRAGLQFDVVQNGVDIAQRFDPHLQTESDFERAFPRPRALEFHFVGILVHPHENLRKRDVFLGVEIGGQLLVGQDLIADQNPLPGIDPAKSAAQERPAANRDCLRAVILQQDQIVIAKGEEAIVSRSELFRVTSAAPFVPKESDSSGDAPRW